MIIVPAAYGQTRVPEQPSSPSVGPQLVHKVPLVVPCICNVPKPTFLILAFELSPLAVLLSAPPSVRFAMNFPLAGSDVDLPCSVVMTR